MTLRIRNFILITLAIISAAGSGVLIFGLISASSRGNPDLFGLISALLFSLFSTISCISIFFSFRNTTSFEIFFYYLFIFSMFFDIFRLEEIFILTKNLWETFPMLMTRLVYYGRFAGVLALFCSGLFATGLEYHRIGLTAFLISIIPAALVMVMPVDTSVIIPGNTWKVGGFKEIFSAILLINLIAVINFIIAGLKNENKDYFIITVALLLSIFGRELSFYFQGMTGLLPGLLLLSAGTTVFSLRVHHLYMWD